MALTKLPCNTEIYGPHGIGTYYGFWSQHALPHQLQRAKKAQQQQQQRRHRAQDKPQCPLIVHETQ